MSASAVQFRGVDNVLAAYKANRVGPFAILNGRQILFSSEDVEAEDVDDGATQLQEFLEMMKKGGSEAKYTLQTYKLKSGQEIDSNTAYFRSFNFTLFGAGENTPYADRQHSLVREVNERIDRLEKLLIAEREQEEIEEEDDEEEDRGVIGVLNGLIEIPEVRNAIGMAAIGLVSKIIPMQQKQNQKIAGSDGSQPGSVLDQEQLELAQQAINILASKDTKLGDHLMKIAQIAQNDPARYKLFAQML
jgi:hypothetical protein